MFMETIYTPGVAHLWYLLGDGGRAAMVDPRRDVEMYLQIAQREGAKITHIFETHRNEDYVVGSLELARRTGAEKRLDDGGGFTLLDVRSKEEFASGQLRNAVQIYVGELPSKIGQVPKGRPVTTFCGSGQRAMIAAAFLRRQGVEPVETCLGSLSACSDVEC